MTIKYARNSPSKKIDEQTPRAMAEAILCTLNDLHSTLELGENSFYEMFVKRMLDGDISGEHQLAVILELEDANKTKSVAFKTASLRLGVFVAACAFAVQAVKAQEMSARAWYYVAEANRLLGTLQGLLVAGNEDRCASTIAAKRSEKSHSNERSLRDDIFRWCDDNRSTYKSRSKAAKQAKNIVPVKERTILGWIKQWDEIDSGSGY